MFRNHKPKCNNYIRKHVYLLINNKAYLHRHTQVEMLLSGSRYILFTKWQKCVSSAIHVCFSVTQEQS